MIYKLSTIMYYDFKGIIDRIRSDQKISINKFVNKEPV